MATFIPWPRRRPFGQIPHSVGRHIGAWHFWFAELGHTKKDRQINNILDASSTSKERQFEDFFLKYDRAIAGYLWRMIGDEQIVCELSQETFLRAWQHFDTISDYEQPGAWLFHVATNLALQHLQHRSRMPVPLAEPFDPASSDPTQRFVEQDLVHEILLALPPKLRAVLLLREVYGMSCGEAANALGMSYNAAKMAFWRAREQFRALYLRKDGGQ